MKPNNRFTSLISDCARHHRKKRHAPEREDFAKASAIIEQVPDVAAPSVSCDHYDDDRPISLSFTSGGNQRNCSCDDCREKHAYHGRSMSDDAGYDDAAGEDDHTWNTGVQSLSFDYDDAAGEDDDGWATAGQSMGLDNNYLAEEDGGNRYASSYSQAGNDYASGEDDEDWAAPAHSFGFEDNGGISDHYDYFAENGAKHLSYEEPKGLRHADLHSGGKEAALPKHAPAYAPENEIALVPKPAQTDPDDTKFRKDLEHILSGGKPKLPEAPTRSTAPKPAADAGGGHAIFEKIAQNMKLATAYDLGAVSLEQKFDSFEKDMEDGDDEDDSPELIAAANPRKDTGEFLNDMDKIQRTAKPDPVTAELDDLKQEFKEL